MNEASVTIAFPDEALARRFLMWLDHSGDMDFEDVAGSEDMFGDEEQLTFTYDIDKLFCRVMRVPLA